MTAGNNSDYLMRSLTLITLWGGHVEDCNKDRCVRLFFAGCFLLLPREKEKPDIQAKIRGDFLSSEAKQRQTTSGNLWSRETAFNISRVTVNCFPFDVIALAMLPANGIWRETVSLLDVKWPMNADEWARCGGRNASYIYNYVNYKQ